MPPPAPTQATASNSHADLAQAFQDLAKYNISSWPTFQSRILLRSANRLPFTHTFSEPISHCFKANALDQGRKDRGGDGKATHRFGAQDRRSTRQCRWTGQVHR
ncbi:hypothetical protein ABVK25_005006 [Lepraria finkii]|uniref:Uncharacterized protein n=1 Tax=Lepraria finkii TaxID=1340010 RepID=A0ABR4BA30_9LECA